MSRWKVHCRTLGLCLLIALHALGCGERKWARVKGTVTLDGDPLPDARVVFSPTNGGPSSHGKTDENGAFELVSTTGVQGALIAEHQVTIFTADMKKTASGKMIQIPEKVPERYNANTELTETVDPGTNEVTFTLHSDK